MSCEKTSFVACSLKTKNKTTLQFEGACLAHHLLGLQERFYLTTLVKLLVLLTK